MLEELDLHVTNKCTENCKYCCFSSNRLWLNEMSFEKICELLQEAKELGCKHVHITGGEPLTRNDILEIISYTYSLGLEVRLQTNGMLLNNSIAKKIKKSGLKSIMISLDSANRQIHDRMRGEGTYDCALKAINNAMDVGLDVRVNSVLTKNNYDDIYETIVFVNKLGVKKYSAFYFSPIGSGKEIVDEWIEPDKYIEFWDELNKKIVQNPDLCNMDIIIEKGYSKWNEAKNINVASYSGCGGGCVNTFKNRDYLIVRCDGNVYPCIMAIDSNPLGNIFKDTLSSIYRHSLEWEHLRPVGNEECNTCEHKNICNEGCRYYPNVYHSSVTHDCRCVKDKLVPLCPIMKYNFINNLMGGSSEDVMAR